MKQELIFDWPARHHLYFLLPITLGIAAVLHAGFFFLFFIVYPRQERLAVDPARVYYVPGGAPEFARLSALLQSADPSVFAPGRGLALAETMVFADYSPQYDAARGGLDVLPVLPSLSPTFVTVPKPIPVLGGEAERSSLASKAALPVARLVATGGLARRIPPALPQDARLQPAQDSSPGETVFLAAVRGDGSVAHVFFQQSSGDEELDKMSAKVLHEFHFSNSPDVLEWGFVHFQWGVPDLL